MFGEVNGCLDLRPERDEVVVQVVDSPASVAPERAGGGPEFVVG